MGGFIKKVGQLGATGAATVAGGPLAGAGVASGLGMLGGLTGGGNFYDMMGQGLQSGLGQYLSGPTLLEVLQSQQSNKPNTNMLGPMPY